MISSPGPCRTLVRSPGSVDREAQRRGGKVAIPCNRCWPGRTSIARAHVRTVHGWRGCQTWARAPGTGGPCNTGTTSIHSSLPQLQCTTTPSSLLTALPPGSSLTPHTGTHPPFHQTKVGETSFCHLKLPFRIACSHGDMGGGGRGSINLMHPCSPPFPPASRKLWSCPSCNWRGACHWGFSVAETKGGGGASIGCSERSCRVNVQHRPSPWHSRRI